MWLCRHCVLKMKAGSGSCSSSTSGPLRLPGREALFQWAWSRRTWHRRRFGQRELHLLGEPQVLKVTLASLMGETSRLTKAQRFVWVDFGFQVLTSTDHDLLVCPLALRKAVRLFWHQFLRRAVCAALLACAHVVGGGGVLVRVVIHAYGVYVCCYVEFGSHFWRSMVVVMVPLLEEMSLQKSDWNSFPWCLVPFEYPTTAFSHFWPRTVCGVKKRSPILRNIGGPLFTPPADCYWQHGLDAIFVIQICLRIRSNYLFLSYFLVLHWFCGCGLKKSSWIFHSEVEIAENRVRKKTVPQDDVVANGLLKPLFL